MGAFGIWHWLFLGLVVLLLFGKGRFSGMMGDVAKGLKEFKKGMAEEDDANAPSSTNIPPRIDAKPDAAPQQPTLDGKPVPPHDPRI